MDKATYNRIRAIVAVGIGLVMAFSVLRNSWALASGSVALAMGILFIARKQVNEVLHDERSIIIREKAANATLNLVVVAFAVIGLGLVETSFWGYTANREYGYVFAYIALIIMGINGFYNWYFNNRLGG